VISYRSLKKLIGESSLERKCRFLFGFALLFLITASFWLYAYRTQKLVENQQVFAARMLLPRLLEIRHQQRFIQLANAEKQTAEVKDREANTTRDAEATNSPDAEPAAPLSTEARPDLPELELLIKVLDQSSSLAERENWTIISAANEPPNEDDGFEARRRFLDEDDPEDEYWVIKPFENEPRKLIYYAAIRMENACRVCHNDDGTAVFRKPDLKKELGDLAGSSPTPTDAAKAKDSSAISETASKESVIAPEPPNSEPSADGAMAATSAAETESVKPIAPLHSMVQIDVSLEAVDAQLSRNRAILMATAIVTSFLAMLAAYAIVRYIIVKPVQHLKDVSDEIARGNLNLRAEISTGDEFEELSHAFNRMLRHMMTVNDELRQLNDSLDGKIDQLAQANMELFNNNKVKDDFLATISHELRTPLNSILGFSDILQGAVNLDDRQKRYVQNIQTSGQSLMVQINDLLDLAKIESGKMQLHPGEVQLADILDLQVQQIMPLADRKNIDLRIETNSQTLPLLNQDRSKISQILQNLLSNAIKFTPEGGRVRVASRQIDPEFVEFSVEDTGIGIPLQEQEHIFEKFRQGSTVPGGRDHVKREYEGTGLGLSIVRELARLMGGDVSLRSEFGKGSLFSVRLPVAVPEKKLEPILPALESRSSTSLPRITSVDLLSRDASSTQKTNTTLTVEVHSIPAKPG
jgi:signal transduction histidine kinase